MTPELGQGACQAILDAWAVADALAGTADPAAAFRTYEQRRRRRAALVTFVARALAVGGNQEGRAARAIRERVMTMTPASVMLRRLEFVTRA
jgi:2-polyprenyl-6-methoxyphenol hydroxylase-like FAD-dependent oxidoreductase